MLDGRGDALGLQPADVGRADRAGQPRVLGEALEVAAAERRAVQVDGRGEQHVDALAAALERQQPAQPLDQRRRPRSRPAPSATARWPTASRSSHSSPRTPAGPSDMTIRAQPDRRLGVQRPEVGAGQQAHLLLEAQRGEALCSTSSMTRQYAGTMRALIFDVFGTCVDWRTSIQRVARPVRAARELRRRLAGAVPAAAGDGPQPASGRG